MSASTLGNCIENEKVYVYSISYNGNRFEIIVLEQDTLASVYNAARAWLGRRGFEFILGYRKSGIKGLNTIIDTPYEIIRENPDLHNHMSFVITELEQYLDTEVYPSERRRIGEFIRAPPLPPKILCLPSNIVATVKIAFIGYGGVGKSTFIKRMSTGNFDPERIVTESIEGGRTTIETSAGKVDIIILDFPGQQDSSGRDVFLKNIDAVGLFYDTSCATTYYHLQMWLRDLKNMNIAKPIVLIGSKLDVGVSHFLKKDALGYGAPPGFWISSKTGEGIDLVVKKLISIGLKNTEADVELINWTIGPVTIPEERAKYITRSRAEVRRNVRACMQ